MTRATSVQRQMERTARAGLTLPEAMIDVPPHRPSRVRDRCDLKVYLQTTRRRLDQRLDGLLANVDSVALREAMRYTLLGAGKRLRGILCLATCDLLRGDDGPALDAACALEMLHAMSLIHDDLPAMDNASTRRGEPANHVVHGEALAILAGDALLARAFEVLSAPVPGVAASTQLTVLRLVAEATTRMAMGQALEFAMPAAMGMPLIEAIHTRKTASLFAASTRVAALLAGGHADDVTRLTRFGQCLGLAFQYRDDVSDRVVDSTGDRLSAVHVVGEQAVRRELGICLDAALSELTVYGDAASVLVAVVHTLRDPA